MHLTHKRILPFLLLFLLLAGSIRVANSVNTQYSEKIDVYIAGNHALWSLTFSGINVTKQISEIENVQGINSYNLTAIDTSNWLSDYQIYGPNGYNIINLPYIPVSGIFLTVNSSSSVQADLFAQNISKYFYTQFVKINSSNNIYSFFAPVSFSEVLKNIILKLYPTKAGGFSSLISLSSLINQGNVIILLSAVRNQYSFAHSLTVSSITNSVLTPTGSINLLTVIGSSSKFIQPSNKSAMTSITIKVLDGLLYSPDNATVINDQEKMESSYFLNLKPSERIYKVNVTISQQLPSILVKRLLDTGSLLENKLLSVTLSFTNVSNVTVYNVTVRDNWWKTYSFFKISSGDSELRLDNLTSGMTTSRTYVLNYTGSKPMTLVIPPAKVDFFFKLGNKEFNDETYSNGATLSLNSSGPGLYAYLSEQSSQIQAGSEARLTLNVFNVGSGPANNVSVYGQSVQTIPQAGGSWSVVIPTRKGITISSFSQNLNITYYTPEGNKVVFETNTLTINQMHNAMEIPFAQVTINGTFSQAKGVYNVTVTISVSNKGNANISSFYASTSLPSAFSCGKTSPQNLTCTKGNIALRYSSIPPFKTLQSQMSFLLNSSGNLILYPLRYSFFSTDLRWVGISNVLELPTGLKVVKTVSPSLLFKGMKALSSIFVYNHGQGSYYNVTVSSSADNFDQIVSGNNTAKLLELRQGSNISLSYNLAIISGNIGNNTMSPVSVNLFFGGRMFSLSLATGSIQILKEPFLNVKVVPSMPKEGSEFFLLLNITNPSVVTVQNVYLSFRLPEGLNVVKLSNAEIVSRNITIAIPSLGPKQSYISNVSLVSSPNVSVDIEKSSFTFSYDNQNIRATLPSTGFVVLEDVTTRYILPSLLALLAILVSSFYLRFRISKKSNLVIPSSFNKLLKPRLSFVIRHLNRWVLEAVSREAYQASFYLSVYRYLRSPYCIYHYTSAIKCIYNMKLNVYSNWYISKVLPF